MSPTSRSNLCGHRSLVETMWTATPHGMGRVSSRLVVGTCAGMRLAIGVAFALAPDRLSRRSVSTPQDTLMARSFAVREAVLGIGGLLAATRPEVSPSTVKIWAGLGAVTDGGDLASSLVSVLRRDSSGRLPALIAGGGLLAELWAFLASSDPERP